MKRILLVSILILSIFLASCSLFEKEQELPTAQDLGVEVQEESVEEPQLESEEDDDASMEPTELETGCKVDADCDVGTVCIDGACGTVAELYETECEKTCTFKDIEISTSFGDSYVMNRGQGSYTFAGATEWKLLPGPAYCPGEKVLVPIKVSHKSYGEVLSTEVLTMYSGETSKAITNPTSGKSFTLTIDKVNEECG